MKELSPRLTLFVFLYVGILIVIVTGLLVTEEFYDFGDSIYSWDEIESGSIQTHPLDFDVNFARIEMRIDVLHVQDIDVYLVEAPNEQSDDLNDMRIIRSGVYRHDYYEAMNLHWTVDSDELGDGVLLLVVDNTDEGVVPATNESIEVITRFQSTIYPNPLTLPVTWGLIIISIVFFVLIARYYRKLKGKRSIDVQQSI
jgi:hypothetical protein